ncbi:MAG TPA: YcxB family protein [Terriglobia bacterium]|nr:YcxB family protein [Terriglobia bacterium]
MEINFTLTADDYQEFMRAYYQHLAGFWQRHQLAVFVSFGVICILGGLNWTYVEHRGALYGSFCDACGLFLVLFGFWSCRWKWRRWFAQNSDAYQNIFARFDEDGTTVRRRAQETKTQWEYYKGYEETENLILIAMPGGTYLIVPKRAFGGSDLGSFRQLLQNRFGTAERK